MQDPAFDQAQAAYDAALPSYYDADDLCQHCQAPLTPETVATATDPATGATEELEWCLACAADADDDPADGLCPVCHQDVMGGNAACDGVHYDVPGY